MISDGDLQSLISLTANDQHSNAILERKSFVFFGKKCHTEVSMIIFNILKYSINLLLLVFGKLELHMCTSLGLFCGQTLCYAMAGLL